ncbi:MAG: ribosome maturation factor RimP [Nitrospirae bacterium]|nr:ribosome maturation factor RimP [Nitrospirota bacterium]
MSRQASVVLDVEDPIAHGYTLEVSSPGLDRPLKKIEDFLKFAGKQVKVKTKQPRDGQSVFEGRILEVREGTVRLETAPAQVLEIPYTEIAQARLVVETFRGR